jgi:hypothetical protein
MLSRGARRARVTAVAVVLALVVLGSVVGDDDNWPFGPFRMYSTTTRPGGTVTLPFFEAVTEGGRKVELTTDDVGLRRAEVLGQMDRLRADPELLGDLATAHARLHPDAPRLSELRLVTGVHRLEQGRSVSLDEEVVASWRRGPR